MRGDKARGSLKVKLICNVAIKFFDIDPLDFYSDTRKREVVFARQVAMYFSARRTKQSLANIGRQISNKDHATVLHAKKTVKNLMETDKEVFADVDAVEKLIKIAEDSEDFKHEKLTLVNLLVAIKTVSITNEVGETGVFQMHNRISSVDALERFSKIAKTKGYIVYFQFEKVYKTLEEDTFKISVIEAMTYAMLKQNPAIPEEEVKETIDKFIDKIDREYNF